MSASICKCVCVCMCVRVVMVITVGCEESDNNIKELHLNPESPAQCNGTHITSTTIYDTVSVTLLV